MEKPQRLHRCCFTGHRPEKLNIPKHEIIEKLRKEIKKAIQDGFTTFISGMARGIDLWSAEIVLEERKINKNIHLICAVPFHGFENRWNLEEKLKFNNILKKADYVKYVCSNFSNASYQIRNCYMVDNSARIICAYNGEKGGTQNTIKYAITKKIEIVNIFDIDLNNIKPRNAN